MAAGKRKSYGRSRTISQPGQLPLFVPETSWKPISPSDWPDFRQAKLLGMDVESNDPNLLTDGPGYIRDDAFVCGISMATEYGDSIYLPIAHCEDNYDKDQVIRYIKDQMKAPNRKVGANLMYEYEALWSLGITEINGQQCDIQTAEPLLDEDRKDGYTLEVLAQDYLGEGKIEAGLREAAQIYGVEPKKGMQWIPGRFVAEYAEADAYKPIEIFMQQEERIYNEDLVRVWELESKLLPILWKMRLKGVRVDLDYFHMLSKEYAIRQDKLHRKMDQLLGRKINFNSGKEIGYALENLDYTNIRMVKGEYSVDNEWLTQHEGDEICDTIKGVRVVAKMKKDFVDNIIRVNVNGRLHPQWHALRGSADDDDPDAKKTKGTRGGRMSSTRINLQQIPARDEVYGPEIRKGFVGEKGEKFVKNDWASQEPRWMVEFAYRLKHSGIPKYADMPVVDEFIQMFVDDPKRDYHKTTIQLIKERASMDIPRPKAKDLSLGRMYGMQRNKMALRLGTSLSKADEILSAYDRGVPFLSILIEAVIDRVKEKGFIRTASGRKRRFDRWEPTNYDVKKRYGFEYTVATEAEARQIWGSQYQRAFLHKVLNAMIQGSAGDQCKECIVELDARGILPLMAVHDELNASESDDETYVKDNMRDVMENQMKTHIPFYAEQFTYNTWGGER